MNRRLADIIEGLQERCGPQWQFCVPVGSVDLKADGLPVNLLLIGYKSRGMVLSIIIYIYNMPSNLMQLYPVHSVDTGQDCMSYPDRLLSTRLSERFTSLFSTVDSLTDRRSFSAWSWDCGFATQSNRPALLGITKLL